MSNPTTLAGTIVSICATAQNDDLSEASPGFAGLTYVPIADVGNIGEYGYTTNMVTYSTLGRVLNRKAKGSTDGGDWSIEFAIKTGDAGQLAVRAASSTGGADYQDNYAFKIAYPNGDVDYIRGPVSGPVKQGGDNEAFQTMSFTVGVNEILEVPAT